jgi:hypothetical protein
LWHNTAVARKISLNKQQYSETKKIKQITKSFPPLRTPQGTWARRNDEKAHAFAKHLKQVFQPHPLESTPEEDLIQLLGTPYQLKPPIKRLKRTEVQETINNVNHTNSQGYDLINGRILKELPTIGIQYLT